MQHYGAMNYRGIKNNAYIYGGQMQRELELERKQEREQEQEQELEQKLEQK